MPPPKPPLSTKDRLAITAMATAYLLIALPVAGYGIHWFIKSIREEIHQEEQTQTQYAQKQLADLGIHSPSSNPGSTPKTSPFDDQVSSGIAYRWTPPELLAFIEPNDPADLQTGQQLSYTLDIGKDGTVEQLSEHPANPIHSISAQDKLKSALFIPASHNGSISGCRIEVSIQKVSDNHYRYAFDPSQATPLSTNKLNSIQNPDIKQLYTQWVQAGESRPIPIVTSLPTLKQKPADPSLQASFSVSTTIDTQGHPSCPEITETNVPDLNEAMLEAIQQWHFLPAKENGQAISKTVTIPIRFRLGDAYQSPYAL